MSQAARRGESQGLTLSAVHGDSVRLVLEQLWGELIQVVSPVGPSVTTGGFLIHHVEIVLLQRRHSRPGGFDLKVVFACAEPDELYALLKLWIVEHFAVFLFECGAGRRTVRAAAAKVSEEAGAEDAYVTELIEMRHCDIQGLAATHGKASDGALRLACMNAIGLFDLGQDVGGEFLHEFVCTLPATAGAAS